MLVRSSHVTFGGEIPGLTVPCKVQVLGVLMAQLGAAWRSPPHRRCLRRSGRSQRVKSSTTATRYYTGALTDACASKQLSAGILKQSMTHRNTPYPRTLPLNPPAWSDCHTS